MTHAELVFLVAENVPGDLRRLRARLMIEEECDWLGVPEVSCPACSGCGWADLRSLETCPVCLGFRVVPGHLADWFRAKTDRLGQPAGTGEAPVEAAGVTTVDFGDQGAALRSRYGRRADAPLRCSAPVGA